SQSGKNLWVLGHGVEAASHSVARGLVSSDENIVAIDQYFVIVQGSVSKQGRYEVITRVGASPRDDVHEVAQNLCMGLRGRHVSEWGLHSAEGVVRQADNQFAVARRDAEEFTDYGGGQAGPDV